ncbi:hypothetical protein [Ruegeria atlantica]|nr:hypothetical protein [Ruegeria atlantica]
MNRNFMVIAAVLVVLLLGLTMMTSVEEGVGSEETAPAAETEATTATE